MGDTNVRASSNEANYIEIVELEADTFILDFAALSLCGEVPIINTPKPKPETSSPDPVVQD